MQTIAIAVIALSSAAWVGAILFQSAVVAPSVFTHLDPPAAGRLLRGLFPRFYRFGITCGVLMLIGMVSLGVIQQWRSPLLALAAIVSLMLGLQALSLRLVPAINAARDAGDAGASRFARLHAISVVLTVVNLVLGASIVTVIGIGPRLAGGI